MQAGGELDTRVPYDDLIRTDFAEKAMAEDFAGEVQRRVQEDGTAPE